jgi:hypothetical protein
MQAMLFVSLHILFAADSRIKYQGSPNGVLVPKFHCGHYTLVSIRSQYYYYFYYCYDVLVLVGTYAFVLM